ncbi:MAG: hypothetical protein ACM3QU_14435 [Verrucomicrobiota bacterium]
MPGAIWQAVPETVSFGPEHVQWSNAQSLDVVLAVRTIGEVVVKAPEQVGGHEMPAGLLVTVPVPATVTLTVVVAADRPAALPAPSRSATTPASGTIARLIR